MDLFARLANAWKIFVLSLSFVKRDKSLLIIPVLYVLSAIVFFVPFILAVVVLRAGLNDLFFFVGMFVLLFLSHFWFTFLGAAQVWMVYEVAQGKDTTLASGIKRALHNFLDILGFAFVMLVISLIAGKLKQKGTLGQIAGNWLETLAGIVGKLVLPAMIVTERNFGDAVKQLRDSVKAIPEIATFEIGIGPLIFLAVVFGIVATVVLGFLNVFVGIFFAFAYFLALIMIAKYINYTYYTILYLTLVEKKKIKDLKLEF